MNKKSKIFILTTIVLLGLISVIVLLYKHQNTLIHVNKRMQQMASIPLEIKYYDEVLTMSAYMASFKNGAYWIERYNKAEKSILTTISNALKMFPHISKHFDDIARLGDILITLEKKSFTLVKEKKLEEAQAILFSENYNRHKILYIQKLEKIVTIIEAEVDTYTQETEKIFQFLIFVIILVMVSSIFLSMLVYLIIRKQNKNIIRSQESLNNQYTLLEKIIDTVPVRIFWKDKEGIYLGVNNLFLSDAGLTHKSEIIGKNDFDMTWRRDAIRFREDDAAVVQSGIPRLLYEEEQPKEDGSVIYVVTSKVPLRDIHNNIIGILGIYDDISEQKILEEKNKKQKEYLIVQSRLAQMGEMISMIAHQWRQPLAAISATSSDTRMKIALKTFDLTTEKGRQASQNYLINQHKKIDRYTQSLTRTINDFRNFYKPNKQASLTTFEEPVNKALDIVSDSFLSENIAIIKSDVMTTSSEMKAKMYTNELMQVILNILKNSKDNFKEKEIKNPKITMAIQCHTNDKMTLEIYDNGGGIPEDILPKIFDPYFSTKDEMNGSGLGLYMSRIIIEDHHKGKLLVRNQNDGVCFSIELGLDC